MKQVLSECYKKAARSGKGDGTGNKKGPELDHHNDHQGYDQHQDVGYRPGDKGPQPVRFSRSPQLTVKKDSHQQKAYQQKREIGKP